MRIGFLLDLVCKEPFDLFGFPHVLLVMAGAAILLGVWFFFLKGEK